MKVVINYTNLSHFLAYAIIRFISLVAQVLVVIISNGSLQLYAVIVVNGSLQLRAVIIANGSLQLHTVIVVDGSLETRIVIKTNGLSYYSLFTVNIISARSRGALLSDISTRLFNTLSSSLWLARYHLHRTCLPLSVYAVICSVDSLPASAVIINHSSLQLHVVKG